MQILIVLFLPVLLINIGFIIFAIRNQRKEFIEFDNLE
jgi:preprotein translocase subunit YajC